jgi:hypothetical protein
VSTAPVADRAARLAAAVDWLGEPVWRDEVGRLAGEGGAGARAEAPPTFGEVAIAGLGLVQSLAQEGRWDDAAGQARRLARFFADAGVRLGPVAGPVFDGLLASCLARDPDELADVSELVEEIFA